MKQSAWRPEAIHSLGGTKSKEDRFQGPPVPSDHPTIPRDRRASRPNGRNTRNTSRGGTDQESGCVEFLGHLPRLNQPLGEAEGRDQAGVFLGCRPFFAPCVRCAVRPLRVSRVLFGQRVGPRHPETGPISLEARGGWWAGAKPARQEGATCFICPFHPAFGVPEFQ